jgi:pantoate--beta-alanine ligase
MSTPRVVERIAELRELLDAERAAGRRIGFVPTMGSLHEGHARLMRRARAENEVVVVSIFVNPLQFGPSEDFAAYPRDFERDLAFCAGEEVPIVFHPSVEEMYPQRDPLTIEVGPIGDVLCGRTRPGHFNGVATVVAKLFNIVGRCRAYFGEKDAQQVVVIRRLAKALDFPVTVVCCGTVREPDGLAMSSRNAYLTPPERQAALVLYRALAKAHALVDDGVWERHALEKVMVHEIEAEPLARLDYAVCVDPDELTEPAELGESALLAVAAWVGKARLIDNMTVYPASPSGARTGTSTEEASITKG